MSGIQASGDGVVPEAGEEVQTINVARPHLLEQNLPWIGRREESEEESVQDVEDVQGLHIVQVQSRLQALQHLRDYEDYRSGLMNLNPAVRNLDFMPNLRVSFRPERSDRIARNNGLRPNRRTEFYPVLSDRIARNNGLRPNRRIPISLPSSGEPRVQANFNPGEVPLPDEKIQSLRTFKYGSKVVGKLNNGDKECPICFEKWENKSGLIMELVCKHHFHSVCAVKNFRIRSTCPLCRKDQRN